MLNKSYGGEHRSQTPVPTVTTIARPDQAHFHLQVAVETETAAAAVPLLKRAAQRLEELLPQLGAKLTVTDFDLPHESGKLAVGAPSRLHATLVVPLAKDAGFWERAQKLAQVDDLLRALVLEGKKQKPALEVRRDLPVFVVGDPEAHRAALVQRLHERAKSLGAPVLLKDLRFDRPVTQRPLGLEEVELSLPVEGAAELSLT
jgi:hypothetical protein